MTLPISWENRSHQQVTFPPPLCRTFSFYPSDPSSLLFPHCSVLGRQTSMDYISFLALWILVDSANERTKESRMRGEWDPGLYSLGFLLSGLWLRVTVFLLLKSPAPVMWPSPHSYSTARAPLGSSNCASTWIFRHRVATAPSYRSHKVLHQLLLVAPTCPLLCK